MGRVLKATGPPANLKGGTDLEKPTSYINYAGLLEFLYLQHENTDLYLSHCGMQQCKPGHIFEHRPRPEYHLHFILDGHGVLRIYNREYRLSRGQIFVIPPDIEDYSYQADSQKPWYYAWAAFNGTKADYYMTQAGFQNESVVRQSNIPPEEFTTLIYDMLKASQLTIANELDRTASLYLLLAKLIESRNQNAAHRNYDYSNDTYIKQALQYIQFNYNQPIQIHDIVNYVGINRSYFSHMFKQNMGVSPKEYLQQYRMEHACALLKDTSDPIEAVAKKVGYQDPFTFSRLFKKLTGMSPRDYRRFCVRDGR